MKECDIPSWIKRTKKETKVWKASLGQKKCGDTFEWISEGWNSSYEVNAITICLEVGEGGKLGCASGDCINNSNECWFGKTLHTRGEYNVYKHACSYHRPVKKTKGTAIAGMKRKSQGNSPIESFFRAVLPKPTKQQRNDSLPLYDIVTKGTALSFSTLSNDDEPPPTLRMVECTSKETCNIDGTVPF